MDVLRRYELVAKDPVEEIVTKEQLLNLLETNSSPKHYIGFEVSGFLHLGALMAVLKIKDFEKAGFKTNIFLADYHAWINKKLSGDLELIQKVAKGYFIDAMKAFGINSNFLLASELYDNDYWKLVLSLSSKATINRVLRCVTIMGRKEGTNLESSAVIYPLMQAADIFYLNIDLAHAGMDQRKVHMLARELNPSFVALHTHLLPSLKQSSRMNYYDPLESKMSKSIPDSAIFLHDSEEDIKRKIKKAYCPEKTTEGNPVYEIAKHIIFHEYDELVLERPEKFGGDITLTKESLEKEYLAGNIHPLDLKSFTSKYLAEILRPARDYFKKNRESIELLMKAKITR